MNKSDNFSLPKFIKLLCSIAVSVIFIYILIKYQKEVFYGISKVNPVWALSGCGFYILNYYFRVSRMMELANIDKFSVKFVYLVLFHGFATYMMPLQSGDFFLPFILKNTADKNLKEGLAILFLIRVIDIFAVGFLIAVSFIFFNTGLSDILSFLWGGTGIIMLMIPLTIKYLGNPLKKLIRVTDFFVNYIVNSLGNTRVIIKSILIWCCIIGCIYCAIRAAGLDIRLSQVVFLTSIQLPFQIMPLQGIANTGVHEGSWILALTAIGFSSKEALLVSITTHALIILYVMMIGFTALILYLSDIFFQHRTRSSK